MKTDLEIYDFVSQLALDYLELISEQKGDKNILKASYEGSYETCKQIMEFIEDKDE